MSVPSSLGAASRLDVPTVVDALRFWAEAKPDFPLFTFLSEDGEEELSVTCRELDARARALGAFLSLLGLAGERALLLFAPGVDFIAAFLGCLYAGVLAVPASPPITSQQYEAHAPPRPRHRRATAAPR